MHMAGKLDIETRWAQEVVERHRGAGEIRILKQHKRKKLWRGQRGEAYIWNQIKWMQEVVGGTGGEDKVRYWNQMSAASCWEMRGEA